MKECLIGGQHLKKKHFQRPQKLRKVFKARIPGAARIGIDVHAPRVAT